jgi:hypothetical protein
MQIAYLSVGGRRLRHLPTYLGAPANPRKAVPPRKLYESASAASFGVEVRGRVRFEASLGREDHRERERGAPTRARDPRLGVFSPNETRRRAVHRVTKSGT